MSSMKLFRALLKHKYRPSRSIYVVEESKQKAKDYINDHGYKGVNLSAGWELDKIYYLAEAANLGNTLFIKMEGVK